MATGTAAGRLTCAGVMMLACANAARAAPADPEFALRPARDAPAALAQAEPASAEPSASAEGATRPVPREAVEEAAPYEKSLPLNFAIRYYLMSDYVFRGVNFSEYRGEGRERLNHQITTSLSYETKDFGTLGFDTFFEWYEAQKKLNPFGGGQNLQEVDYTVWWEYALEPVDTTVRLGYTFYTFPNLAKLLRTTQRSTNDDRTCEWFIRLSHNDAWAWKWLFPENEEGVLNPTFLLAQDVGTTGGGVWMEFGLSHPFRFETIPDLTVTPGYVLTVDGAYLRKLTKIIGDRNNDTWRLAYQQFGLDVTYDLTRVLALPKWAGSVTLSGLLFFNDALGNAEDEYTMIQTPGRITRIHTVQDEFFGGMALGWSW